MNEEEEPSVLGALPHSRPHRRSAKRETRSVSTEGAATKPAAKRTANTKPAAERATTKKTKATKPAAKRTGTTKPAAKRTAAPRAAAAEPATAAAQPAPPLEEREEPGTGAMGAAEMLTTVVQAAAELAEIGLMAGARALRIAVSRLPRP